MRIQMGTIFFKEYQYHQYYTTVSLLRYKTQIAATNKTYDIYK